jgi:predicted PilT family ATPase
MILRFNQYILEEHSKNEPILEIRDTNKLGIILMGSPGIGKSTFIKNYILHGWYDPSEGVPRC